MYANDYFIIDSQTNKGNRTENQDSILIAPHPKKNDLILASVADGVGGYFYGKETSTFVNNLLKNFFENHTVFTEKQIENQLTHINDLLISDKELGYTTLSLVIANPYKTIIASAGDSRVYSYNHELKQETNDETEVWELYKDNLITKDDLRYIYGSNILTNCFGDRYFKTPKAKTIPTPNLLLLTSDGVHDVLSDKHLQYIIENSSERKKIKKIINDALTYKEKISEDAMDRILDSNSLFYDDNTPAHDNVSAVMIKKIKN